MDPSTAKSQSGWIIFYPQCPIIWASKLQSRGALSLTEAEYIAISMALYDDIPIMKLLGKMKNNCFHIICTQPTVFCKVFQDNYGALEFAHLPKLLPRTKHINVCYYHFQEHKWLGLIKIPPICTEDQAVDMLTKPLTKNLFTSTVSISVGIDFIKTRVASTQAIVWSVEEPNFKFHFFQWRVFMPTWLFPTS
jgi:hypothetical protein